MNGERNLGNAPKNNDNAEDVNENASQDQTIEQSQSENMEVHHHPDLHHKPKKWKEYFLEFIMIFLAVTLGFFAENLREHFVNKDKEYQYMASFYKDFSADESHLPGLINNIETEQIQPANSLPSLLSQADTIKPASIIYIFMRRLFRQQGIKSFITGRTIDQITNAGEIRLISNIQIADSIENYYKQVEYDDYLQQTLLGYKNKFQDDIPLILRAGDYNKVKDAETNIIEQNANLRLGSVDPIAINRILISASEIKALSQLIESRILQLEQKAANIKKLIVGNYGIDK
ncbi:hypothetical protein FW778_16775 [Ginsengibacter hankyongi]|uniref:Uncharacterized protein n=1 Tax=Ginsengibacter hankyongi TaxID=2607284 RepID=A0A5J5IFI0_9BACT|nr:hypothetical protein [Ginsengibacter hankyongi]KAA9037745.1 hypothetical protein FW778_16775 [Ginsengibacter hankyongi]